jgi:hypothetical protein
MHKRSMTFSSRTLHIAYLKRVGGRFVLDGVTPNRRKLLSSLSQQTVVITIYYTVYHNNGQIIAIFSVNTELLLAR